jgi:ABC-type multidrug transport system ATPase subunit
MSLAAVFKDIGYTVFVKPSGDGKKGKAALEPKILLRGVSGYALPGTLTALMGASGAGKTVGQFA